MHCARTHRAKARPAKIQGLPPGFRTVFTLRDIENLSTEETAEALGLSVPAVKSRLLRARLQLRERLSRYLKQPEEHGFGCGQNQRAAKHSKDQESGE